MKKILIAVSSPIVRINGIMKFVEELTSILKDYNHQVDFITDALPDSGYDVSEVFDNFYFDGSLNSYPDLRVKDKPGVVDIVIIPEMTERIKATYSMLNQDYDLIISNDAQCTGALYDTGVCMHYIHTAGLLPGNAMGFLNQSYLDYERDVMLKSTYCGVQTASILEMLGTPANGVVLGLPLTTASEHLLSYNDPEQKGVLFAGEGTFRKGADIFEDTMKQIPLIPCKLMVSGTSEVTFDKLTNKEMQKFDEHHQKEKIAFLKSAKVTLFPSRGEVMPYGLMESLLSGPVLVFPEYEWTKSAIAIGAIPTDKNRVLHDVIRGVKGDLPHYPELVLEYFATSKAQWLDFCSKL